MHFLSKLNIIWWW